MENPMNNNANTAVKPKGIRGQLIVLILALIFFAASAAYSYNHYLKQRNSAHSSSCTACPGH